MPYADDAAPAPTAAADDGADDEDGADPPANSDAVSKPTLFGALPE